MVILPVPEKPSPRPVNSLDIHSLEIQSLCCVHPFHTQDTQGRPFHVKAQESLDVLLRHPSGRADRDLRTFCPLDWSWPQDPNPSFISCIGWWLVENEGQQKAWFPAPYLEVAPEVGLMLQNSGMILAPTPRSLWAAPK